MTSSSRSASSPARLAEDPRAQAILDAALRCFNRLGHADTTLRTIARVAGLELGTVYQHFESKDAVAIALYVQANRSVRRIGLRALARHDGAEQGIRALVETYLRAAAQRPGLTAFLLQQRRASFLLAADERVAALNRSLTEETRAWLAPRIQRGELPDLDMEHYWAILTGPTESYLRAWLARGCPEGEPAAAAHSLADAAWHGLLGLRQAEACGAPPPAVRVPPAGSLPSVPGDPRETVEFYFDLASAFSYLAAHRIDAACARGNAFCRWVPVFAPVIYRDSGNLAPPEMPEARRRWLERDLAHWAERYGLPLRFPPSPFPLASLLPQRALVAAQELGRPGPLALELFRRYWARGRDISEPRVIAAAARRVGLDGAALLERASAASVKERLRANTARATERGVFGLPSFFFRGGLYFGNDRIAWLERDLARAKLHDLGLEGDAGPGPASR